MLKDTKKIKDMEKMSPLDKRIMKTLKCTDFIRRQIKFYLEFSKWALLTWGPPFLKDLQGDNWSP